MQAYASAELTPLVAELRSATFPTVVPAAPMGVSREAPTHFDGTASRSSILASLILDGLDEHGLAVLARRLLPHLSSPVRAETAQAHVAYTVASLATELGISQKAIRRAIGRGELPAVKRGSRWIISADAVHAWATRRRPRPGDEAAAA
jgi:excisionase family DNA binding protein